jgi:hypothetical protein
MQYGPTHMIAIKGIAALASCKMSLISRRKRSFSACRLKSHVGPSIGSTA